MKKKNKQRNSILILKLVLYWYGYKFCLQRNMLNWMMVKTSVLLCVFAGLQCFVGDQSYSYFLLPSRWAAAGQACGSQQARVTEEDNCYFRLIAPWCQMTALMVPGVCETLLNIILSMFLSIEALQSRGSACEFCSVM